MSNIASDGAPLASSPLTRAVLEIDEYTSGLGWDQPARLFALVDTAQLRTEEPGLADQLGHRRAIMVALGIVCAKLLRQTRPADAR